MAGIGGVFGSGQRDMTRGLSFSKGYPCSKSYFNTFDYLQCLHRLAQTHLPSRLSHSPELKDQEILSDNM